MKAMALVSEASFGVRVVIIQSESPHNRWSNIYSTVDEALSDLYRAGLVETPKFDWRRSMRDGVSTTAGTDVSLSILLQQGFAPIKVDAA